MGPAGNILDKVAVKASLPFITLCEYCSYFLAQDPVKHKAETKIDACKSDRFCHPSGDVSVFRMLCAFDHFHKSVHVQAIVVVQNDDVVGPMHHSEFEHL